MKLVWSGEDYKKANFAKKQFLEVEFENEIRNFILSDEVIIVAIRPGDAACKSYSKVALSFDNVYKSNGNYSLFKDSDGCLHAVYKSADFFLGNVVGEVNKFYDGSNTSLDTFIKQHRG